jgi:mRNA interferase HicA
VKRKDLIKRLEKGGFVLVRHGGNHDIYQRGKDQEQIPRHSEINEFLAKSILKKWKL